LPSEPATEERNLPMYISYYINDYGQLLHQRLRTATHILGPNRKIRPDHERIRTSWWVLLPTADHMAVLLLLGNCGYRLGTREAQLVCPAFDALLVLWRDAFADHLRQHHRCKRLLFA